jgi:hypothetical protein
VGGRGGCTKSGHSRSVALRVVMAARRQHDVLELRPPPLPAPSPHERTENQTSDVILTSGNSSALFNSL